MASAEYTVRLDAFEGPLDLLLFLIRRAEVEVADIPIASITQQYLSYLEHLPLDGPGALDIEDAGEFLVMAATLMEIKSRMLAPASSRPGQGNGGGGSDRTNSGEHGSNGSATDPRAELVRQLLDYKRYRDASSQLDGFRKEWEDRYPSGRALATKVERPVDDDAKVEIADLGLVDLVEAFSRIIETVDMSRVGEHHVLMDDTPVELHAEDIVFRLRERLELAPAQVVKLTMRLETGEMSFQEVFEGRSRSDMIGLFLAVLELVKQQRLGVRQDIEGHVAIRLVDAPDSAGVAPVGSQDWANATSSQSAAQS